MHEPLRRIKKKKRKKTGSGPTEERKYALKQQQQAIVCVSNKRPKTCRTQGAHDEIRAIRPSVDPKRTHNFCRSGCTLFVNVLDSGQYFSISFIVNLFFFKSIPFLLLLYLLEQCWRSAATAQATSNFFFRFFFGRDCFSYLFWMDF